MFCDLKGATRYPSCFKARHSAAAVRLLPALDMVPWIIMGAAQRRRREAFARIGHGALDHNGFCFHLFSSESAAASASFSACGRTPMR